MKKFFISLCVIGFGVLWAGESATQSLTLSFPETIAMNAFKGGNDTVALSFNIGESEFDSGTRTTQATDSFTVDVTTNVAANLNVSMDTALPVGVEMDVEGSTAATLTNSTTSGTVHNLATPQIAQFNVDVTLRVSAAAFEDTNFSLNDNFILTFTTVAA